jgi:hypothetical protein
VKIKSVTVMVGLVILLFLGLTISEEALATDVYESPVIAGQDFDNPAGVVLVGKGGGVYDGLLFVIWYMDSPWIITDYHLAVEEDLNDIPVNKKGNPIPGHFEYTSESDELFMNKPMEVAFAFDIEDMGWEETVGETPGTTLYICAHAVVEDQSDTNPENWREETSWADTGLFFNDSGWAMYFVVTL